MTVSGPPDDYTTELRKATHAVFSAPVQQRDETMSEPTLLPCPFCGEHAKIVEKDYESFVKFRATCTGEHCFSPSTDSCESPLDAAEEWNTRAKSPSPTGDGEAVELADKIEQMGPIRLGNSFLSEYLNDNERELILAALRRTQPPQPDWNACAEKAKEAAKSVIDDAKISPADLLNRYSAPQPTEDVKVRDFRAELRELGCKDGHGCNAASVCLCGMVEDCCDEIDRLNSRLAQQASFIAVLQLKIDQQVETIAATEARNVDVSVLAHKWMEAHDKLKAGKPYDFPSPADKPALLARAEAAEQALSEAIEALKPLAVLGIARRETMPELADYNTAFYDCPDDLVLYNDNMGHAITVGDVRTACRVHSTVPRAALTAPVNNQQEK